jgi:hypothetical protein
MYRGIVIVVIIPIREELRIHDMREVIRLVNWVSFVTQALNEDGYVFVVVLGTLVEFPKTIKADEAILGRSNILKNDAMFLTTSRKIVWSQHCLPQLFF